MVDFFSTYIDKDAEAQISRVLRSKFISEGSVVKDFEREFEIELDTFPCLTVNSGTSALHLALRTFDISVGDEVIIPAQTFIATGLSVLYCGAKVVFADIEYETGNICPNSILEKITQNTKAIIMVHWAGLPCNIEVIKEICDKHNLILIEDAAHAVGAKFNGISIGKLSDATCFSFQAIKHLTTGDGGAITFKDNDKFRLAKRLRWFGMNRDEDETNERGERSSVIRHIGYKYHMNNLNAALGLANLKTLKERLRERERFKQIYEDELKGTQGINFFKSFDNRISANWLFGIHVENRISFIKKMKGNNIPVSVVHQRIDRQPVFGKMDESLTVQKKFDETQIHLPMNDNLTEDIIINICKLIKSGW